MPLMTERMVEALEIEGKTYEVHWYDEEATAGSAARTGATRSSGSTASSRRTCRQTRGRRARARFPGNRNGRPMIGRPFMSASEPARVPAAGTDPEVDYQRRAASSTRPELASADRSMSVRKVPDFDECSSSWFLLSCDVLGNGRCFPRPQRTRG